MPLTDLSSSHIRVFNLPFCNLFQQSQGSGSYTWPACIWRLIFSLSSVPSWANDAFSQDWKALRKCYTSKGRCDPVPKELCLRQTTPLSVYPNSPSFGWQQGSKKNKKQYMLGCKRAWHNYFPKKSFKALCCLWSNSLNRREISSRPGMGVCNTSWVTQTQILHLSISQQWFTAQGFAQPLWSMCSCHHSIFLLSSSSLVTSPKILVWNNGRIWTWWMYGRFVS